MADNCQVRCQLSVHPVYKSLRREICQDRKEEYVLETVFLTFTYFLPIEKSVEESKMRGGK